MLASAHDQATLRTALLDPAAEVPRGLVDGRERHAARRFAVYRNNVAVSLIDALEAGFPVVTRLVGQRFFRAMAGTFVRTHPPRSPLIMLYGSDLPGFLASFPPVAHLPYLADVARLEQAIRESYHAADAVPADPATLSTEVLAGARVRLAAGVRVLQSRFPVHGIWLANTSGGPKPTARAEDVLLTRPGFDPVVTLLPRGGAVLAALIAGATVSEAAARETPEALESLFATLLSHGAIVGVEGGAG